jgi:DNA-binding CsgD family transcriptional regulator
MAASSWKLQGSLQSGGAARPNITDIFSRVGNTAPAAPAGVGTLTARERQILHLLAEGRTATAISRQLYISRATVRNHTQHILAKLGLHSKLEAVAYAYRCGLIAPALQA